MRQVRPALPAALLLAVVGCAHLAVSQRSETEVGTGSVGLRDADLGTQTLFRVRYDGARGSGALRLVLKIQDRERYRLETSDRFGRSLWRLDAGPLETLLVDDRNDRYCRSGDEVRIPEIALESLPLRELPAVLLGRLPGDLEPSSGGSGYRDGRGRRWTVSLDRLEPASWTVWQAGEPWLWWQRDGGEGGVLSHRGGSQLRWRRVAVERLSEALFALDLESSHRLIDCEEWAGGLEGGSRPADPPA